jgi:hypothetical protein
LRPIEFELQRSVVLAARAQIGLELPVVSPFSRKIDRRPATG